MKKAVIALMLTFFAVAPAHAEKPTRMPVTIIHREDVTSQTWTPGWIGIETHYGATYQLELPDGRLVVVQCLAKQVLGGWRDCRQPATDNITAEFKGENAKLFWPVSLDGKTLKSETYTILLVLPR